MSVPACERAPGCITCSDEGIPMRVLAVDAAGELAECEDAAGRREEVQTGVVGDVASGDVVLVHAGTALLRLSGAEAGA